MWKRPSTPLDHFCKYVLFPPIRAAKKATGRTAGAVRLPGLRLLPKSRYPKRIHSDFWRVGPGTTPPLVEDRLNLLLGHPDLDRWADRVVGFLHDLQLVFCHWGVADP